DDPEPQEKRGDIAGEPGAVRGVRDPRRGPAVTARADPRRAIGRPEVSEQQRDLVVAETERRIRHAFLVRTLTEDPEAAQPGVVAVRRDEPVPLADGDDVRSGPDQVTDRDAAAVGEDDERVAGDALT